MRAHAIDTSIKLVTHSFESDDTTSEQNRSKKRRSFFDKIGDDKEVTIDKAPHKKEDL
jgi:hypothetical protein